MYFFNYLYLFFYDLLLFFFLFLFVDIWPPILIAPLSRCLVVVVVVVVVLLFFVHGKHPRSCRDGQLT